jgi:DNA-directed RNA polymerase subunit RPC12/RpoP
MSLPEGTPIVCRNCGGGMDMHPDGAISCRYCGARDQLPADQLGRVLEIKNRLAMAEQRTAQVKGFDATFAGVFENPASFVRVMGMYVGIGVLALGMSVATFWTSFAPNLDKLSTADLVQAGIGQLMGPMFIIGFGLSLGAALFNGRRHYRKRLRPLLVASRPTEPNAPFRCRACGGNLPAARDADVPCPYCRTLNLVPKELHGAHSAKLFEEAEAAKQQLLRAHGALMSISGKMRRTLIVCGVVTCVMAYGLPMLAGALLR